MNDEEPLPFERLEVIDDPVPRGGALNMALDEILLAGLAGWPRLRIYRWTGPAVSLGCFSPFTPVFAQWPSRDIVRRWTGGGIVNHEKDFTFSLFVPRSTPLGKMVATDSYRCIHSAVADALARSGEPDAFLSPASLHETRTAECFENPVAFDLLLAGRKVAGGAQRRTRHGLLHQGSVHLAQAALPLLAETLPGLFGREITTRGPTSVELAAAEALAASKYGSTAWLHRC